MEINFRAHSFVDITAFEKQNFDDVKKMMTSRVPRFIGEKVEIFIEIFEDLQSEIFLNKFQGKL